MGGLSFLELALLVALLSNPEEGNGVRKFYIWSYALPHTLQQLLLILGNIISFMLFPPLYRTVKSTRATKLHNNFSMGVKFETSWGLAQKFFKNTLLERVFEKMVSNLSILEGIFEAKFQSWFFFRKNFKGISLIKFTTFLKIKKILKGFLY